jgi:hypothetical protein
MHEKHEKNWAMLVISVGITILVSFILYFLLLYNSDI